MSFHRECLPDPLPSEPLSLAGLWLEDAIRARAQPNPNAMVLATVDNQGAPSARVVLCKGIHPDPGYVTFFTNYLSRKGIELSAHPRAAAVMHWDAQRRQLRLEGPVTRTTAAESDIYFAGRAWQSRIGAWASAQSAPIGSRVELEQATQRVAQRFGTPSPITSDETWPDPGIVIDRPAYWGGFHLWIESCELWSEGAARLHDRARWSRTLTRAGDSYHGSPWRATRLQP
jgi:pyridoxamine 5'-phosphate oxidase